MRCHHIPSRMAEIKRTNNTKSWWRNGTTGTCNTVLRPSQEGSILGVASHGVRSPLSPRTHPTRIHVLPFLPWTIIQTPGASEFPAWRGLFLKSIFQADHILDVCKSWSLGWPPGWLCWQSLQIHIRLVAMQDRAKGGKEERQALD